MKRAAITPARAWMVVILLGVVAGLNYLDRNMIATMRLSLIAAIPMSDARFALLLSTFLWTYALLSPFAGFMTDCVGRSRVIVVSLLVWSGATFLTAHAHTYNELLATRVLMGISEACYFPAALALIMDYHSPRSRSLATGVHMAGVMIGSAMGGAGGWLAQKHTWQYPFALFGAIGMGYSVLLWLTLRDPEPAARPDTPVDPAPRLATTLRYLLAEPSYLCCLGFFALLGILGWGLTGWLPTYFHERFHLDQTHAGFSATGFMNAASFCGVLTGGYLGDRFGRGNPRGRILVPGCGLLIAAVGVLTLSLSWVFWAAAAGLMLYGVTRTFTDSNMMPILCLIAPRRFRGTGYGLLNAVATAAGGLGNFGAGALRDSHIALNHIFFCMTGILFLAAFLVLRVQPNPKLTAYDA